MGTVFPVDPTFTAAGLEARRGRDLSRETHAEVRASGQTLHKLFEQQVQRTPHRIALAYAGQQLTYAALNAKANQLAHFLIGQGIGPEQLVAVCIERSLEMVVGLLGVLKAGAAYVPMDPSYPAERLAYMLADARARVLLTQAALRPRLPHSDATVVSLDTDRIEIARHPEHDPNENDFGLNSRHLAYVIYTSGSTGQPKGAMNEHSAVVNRLHWMQAQYDLRPNDAVLQKTPFSFDVSVWEFFWTLLCGGRLIIARPDGHRDPSYLRDLIETTGVTRLHFVPSMLQSFLVDHPPGRCASLRHIICSGEELSMALQRRCFESLPQVRLSNLYGPTEAAIDVTAWECKSDDTSLRVPIGRPISNVQIYLLDPNRRSVGVGNDGEIYIAGVGVGRGYLGRPDLTAERFVADPFAGDSQARMYKTGDLGRCRADGQIEYLGRSDNQIKIRGYRIELGEIEAHLLQQPQVREAAVVARGNDSDERRLVGYVVVDVPQLKSLSQRDTGALGSEIIREWQEVYEETYSEDSGGPAFAGWRSSYTDQPIAEAQMREWVQETVGRVRSLNPRKILEVGCGIGLLVEQLAPHCEVYRGADISAVAIGQLRRWCATRPELQHVQLELASALELQGIPAQGYDIVLLNSVVQLFPDINYLQSVLDRAVGWVCPGGRIFVGDVRPFSLLHVFQSSVQLERAEKSTTLAELRGRILRSIEREKDLLIDPAFFEELPQRLPGISKVEVNLKRSRSDNELMRYRYDVVLQVGGPTARMDPESLDWKHGTSSLTDITTRMKDWHPASVRIRGIPNRRLSRDVAAASLIAGEKESSTIKDIQELLSEASLVGEDPAVFLELGELHGYEARTSWSAGCYDGRFDVYWVDPTSVPEKIGVFPRKDTVERAVSSQTSQRLHTNDPWGSSLQRQMVPRLREYLKQRLPSYMVPATLVVLDALPLTANGKIDRHALPEPAGRPELQQPYVAPDTPTEESLAEIWNSVLNAGQVGIDDNFFDLGGNSLLGVKLISRISETLKVRVSVLAVFEYPTIREMALSVENAIRTGQQASAPTELEQGII